MARFPDFEFSIGDGMNVLLTSMIRHGQWSYQDMVRYSVTIDDWELMDAATGAFAGYFVPEETGDFQDMWDRHRLPSIRVGKLLSDLEQAQAHSWVGGFDIQAARRLCPDEVTPIESLPAERLNALHQLEALVLLHRYYLAWCRSSKQSENQFMVKFGYHDKLIFKSI